MSKKALVLLSGGLDSSTCITLACKEYGNENVIALTLFYGQKHSKEIESAKAIVKYFNIKEHIIQQLPDIFKGGGSTLVDSDKPNPKMTYEEIDKMYGVSPTYVPFRNANLLSVATTIALVKNAEVIYYGTHSEDAKNWAYPDCTPEFNGAMTNAIFIGSYMKVRLLTPLQWLTKTEVVALGTKIGTPFELTWSCYNGKEISCGVCPTCLGRKRAFKENNLIDSIEYEGDNVENFSI